MNGIERMRIAAFDIGWRNLAWCVTETDGAVLCGMNLVDLGDRDTYRTLHRVLEEHAWLWATCETILVEQQMSTGRITNVRAVKISQHVLAYFMIRFPEKKIMEYSPRHKTEGFGQKKMSKKTERKKWAVAKTVELLHDDPVALDWLGTLPKKDDVCDCFLMTVVYAKNSS
ncbi:hypothetical protein EBZ80_05005 [bacterium]|nr:hypothetical protein [bacterium]